MTKLLPYTPYKLPLSSLKERRDGRDPPLSLMGEGVPSTPKKVDLDSFNCLISNL